MNETRATRYQRLRRRAGAAGLASAALVLLIVALTPLAAALAGFAARTAAGLTDPAYTLAALAVFVTTVVLLWEIATLPATLYLARRIEARYSGATPSVEDVLGAHARAALIVVPAACVAAAVLLLARREAGAAWWLVAAIVIALGRAALGATLPWLLARLTGVRPIARPHLAAQLNQLAGRARVSIHGVHEWTSGEATAAALIAGAGRLRRVFVSTTLVRDWSDDEVAVVVAHELGHQKFHDLRWTAALDAALMLAAIGGAATVVRPHDTAAGGAVAPELAVLPLIALVAGLVWLAATPIRHAQSRRQERRADVFALSLTGGAAAFGAAIRRLGDRHLAEERPSRLVRWFYHRHPSVLERLALAETFQRVENGKLEVRS